MPSFAQQFRMRDADFRWRAVSLAAYALSNSVFEFPLGDVPAAQRAVFPAPASEQVLASEAATAMRGAASAAMVVDQQVGVALTGAAAALYWNAGHFYGAFLWGMLELRDPRVFGVAGEIAERGLRGSVRFPAALVPEQLAYLATGMLLIGQSGIAARLFSLVPQTAVLGPYGLPVSLFEDALGQRQGSEGSIREMGQYLLSSFEVSQRALEFQPMQRRLLPWQVGMPPDSILLLATLLRRGWLAPDDLVITGSYSSALVGAALDVVATPPGRQALRDASIAEILSGWLEQGQS